ncbi:hypothetical protein Trco_001368 [Trichoderma cornu-damae]|uniref:Serine protease n=1 Tax=Trichoderma cornu-damae TaxID=654480 RepID=A0A9P8U056_9HYPO|nr:hypothetical protein Trco_001368 [Trichoderma cornu-damae]
MMISRLSFEFTSDSKMAHPRIIAAGEVHPSRRGNRQPEVSKSLDKARAGFEKSIVRLEFDFGGTTCHGTGFFVNFPTDKYDAIVTAGHNLVNNDKVKARNLTAILKGNDRVMASDFRICPQYEERLGVEPDPPDKGCHDYGIVLLTRDEEQADKRQGLGLNLSLNLHPSLQGTRDVYVSGYGGGADADLQMSSGALKEGCRSQLEYQAPTEQGMSGSPVWAAYDGQINVVGIHNMRPKGTGAGSRGARITEEVMRNLCLWTETGFFGKRLCAPAKKGKQHNTYLSFPRNSDFAKVFLGSPSAAAEQDGLTFDIIPAYISPREAGRAPLYAFKFHKPSAWYKGKDAAAAQAEREKCWVEWQRTLQRAVLVGTLKDVNLVRLQQTLRSQPRGPPPKIPKPRAKRYHVILPTPGEDGQELRLYDDGRQEDDIDDGMTEFAGVSFGPFKEPDIRGNRQCSSFWFPRHEREEPKFPIVYDHVAFG